MDQTKINLEEAKALRVEIEMEFAEVEQILNKVHEECAADPAEDDDVLKAIEAAGNQLEETWGQLETVFKESMSQLEQALNALGDWIKKQMDAVGDFVSKITN